MQSGVEYTMYSADYQDIILDHWEDTGTFSRPRPVTITADAMFTAVYFSNAHPLPEPEPELSGESTLTVNTQFADGAVQNGMWTVLYSGDNTVSTGFSPVSFTLTSGTPYNISVGDYNGSNFHHWENDSTTRLRPINIFNDATVTAYYVSAAHPLPEPEPAPDPEPPGSAQLTVNTQYANGNVLTGMWTTLRQGGATGTITTTGFSPASFTLDTGVQYTVTTSDYQQNTFYQWDNDSGTRARSMTISNDTAITSLYVSPANPPPSTNEPPTAQAVSINVQENSIDGVEITLAGSDPEGQPLTFHPTIQPAKGTLSLVSGNVTTYTPYNWRDGADSFQYVANDGTQDSTPATVSIDISNTGSKTTSRIVVITEYEDGVSHVGYSTTLSQGGTTINSGFSHKDFSVNNGATYSVGVSSGGTFVRWDNGSTSLSRNINIAQDTAIIAVYSRT